MNDHDLRLEMREDHDLLERASVMVKATIDCADTATSDSVERAIVYLEALSVNTDAAEDALTCATNSLYDALQISGERLRPVDLATAIRDEVLPTWNAYLSPDVLGKFWDECRPEYTGGWE